ncbi:hypothetical protein, partial [Methyloglobulus sp.]|uniref:hypothetical protein n=1 Tax=Methyloglobulus sp. TaxID=2518622 RepID=UPI0032B713E8
GKSCVPLTIVKLCVADPSERLFFSNVIKLELARGVAVRSIDPNSKVWMSIVTLLVQVFTGYSKVFRDIH